MDIFINQSATKFFIDFLLCFHQITHYQKNRADIPTLMIRVSASVKPHCLKRGVTSQRVGDALCGLECHSITTNRVRHQTRHLPL